MLLILVITVIFIVLSSIKVVHYGKALVIERLGKYYKTVSGGIVFVFPLIDRVRAIDELREKNIDIPSFRCISIDNVDISVEIAVFYKIVDAQKATYENTNLNLAIRELVVYMARSILGSLKWRDVFSSREWIAVQIKERVSEKTGLFGVTINHIEIKTITFPDEICNLIEKEKAKVSNNLIQQNDLHEINHFEKNVNNDELVNHKELALTSGIHKELCTQIAKNRDGLSYELKYSISYMITNVEDVCNDIIDNHAGESSFENMQLLNYSNIISNNDYDITNSTPLFTVENSSLSTYDLTSSNITVINIGRGYLTYKNNNIVTIDSNMIDIVDIYTTPNQFYSNYIQKWGLDKIYKRSDIELAYPLHIPIYIKYKSY